MSNKKQIKKNQKHTNPLLLLAIGVAAVAIVVVLLDPSEKKVNNIVKTEVVDSTNTNTNTNTNNNATTETVKDGAGIPATLNENGDVVIQIADISDAATFYDLEVNGAPMGLFAVKASDGTVRTAFNTCQICNGSPYAYFKQEGDKFQCQNCGNIYGVDMIETERGGCNPVPIMEGEKTVTDTEIIIPANLLDENSIRFNNWKKF